MVVMSWPSACTARTVQLFTDSPLRWMVHAPHDDVSQPMLVPVSPSVLAHVMDEQRARLDVVVCAVAVHGDLHRYLHGSLP